MSTKIYTAYRLKKSEDFWPFLRETRLKGVENVRKVLTKLYNGLLMEVDTKSEAYQKSLDILKDEQLARGMIVERLICDNYRRQANNAERDPFDFDVSIAVREHEGRLYLIPRCDMLMRRVLDFLKRDPRLEDFSYWNNSDRPEGIAQKEWDQRGEIWDALDRCRTSPGVLYKDGWSDYVLIEICTVQSFWKIHPFMDMKIKRAQREPSK